MWQISSIWSCKGCCAYLTRRAQENTSVAGQTGRELGLIKKELERRRK
jgi:proline dehydrogenase